MDVGFSEEQEILRASARKFLEAECPSAFVRRHMVEPESLTPRFWQRLAEQGWLGIFYPEELGGSGLGVIDLVVLMEEIGRAVMPGPFFATVLLGGAAILEAGSPAQRRQWLPQIAAGEVRATLAWSEPVLRWDAAGITASARAAGSGFILSGRKLFVAEAHQADVLVVALRTREGPPMADGISLFLVPKGADGLSIRVLSTIDPTRQLCEVELAGVRVGAEALLGALHAGWAPLERVRDRALVALAAEMCGGAQRVLEMTAEYAKIRIAFGKPIGSYQGVKHRLADMLVDIENAKSLTYYAAWALDQGLAEAPLAAAMAKAYASDTARKVTAAGIQLHGGIGMTWEHDLHLYLKRAKACEVVFGDATWQRERVARLLTGEEER
jgi:alkylation response protein AidB-like acyl-CoA dehydrogenase